MNTAGDAISFVKTVGRITTQPNDTVLLSWLNKNLVSRTRSHQYPQLLVQGTTFVSTANVSTYALPSNFSRLVDNSVQYGVTSTYSGYKVPSVNFQAAEAWRQLDGATNPSVVLVVASGTNGGKALELLPSFTQGGTSVSYDYIAAVSTFTGTNSTAQVPELLEVLAYDTIADYYNFESKFEEAGQFKQQANALAREANRYLIR